MRIISFINSKGGVGKTTLCVNVCYLLTLSSFRVLLVDADPQGSARDWYDKRDPDQKRFNVIGADRKRLIEDLKGLQNVDGYDYVLIDTPGKVETIVATAISVSDLCLIPVQPSPYDIWSTESIIQLIKLNQTVRPSLKAKIVLNRAIKGTNIATDVFEQINKFEVGALETVIHQRVLYAESAAHGLTPHDYTPVNESTKEISRLTFEIIGLFND